MGTFRTGGPWTKSRSSTDWSCKARRAKGVYSKVERLKPGKYSEKAAVRGNITQQNNPAREQFRCKWAVDALEEAYYGEFSGFRGAEQRSAAHFLERFLTFILSMIT